MSPSRPTHRPSRSAAFALLLLLHAAVIEGFLASKSTRDRPTDGLVTLMLALPKRLASTPLPEPTPSPRTRPPPQPAPRRPPDTAMPATPEPERLRDSAVPVTLPPAPEGGAGSGSSATPSAAPSTTPVAPLNLAIPKEFFVHPPPLTAAQEARRDPRSNRLVLTRREQIDIDFGLYECVAWVREPDGSIYRGPGHLQRVQDVSTNPFNGRRGEECVK